MSAAATLALTLTLGIGSDPYIRSRVDTPDAHCLWWGRSEVTFHQNLAGNPDTTADTEFTATSRALSTWSAASSGCAGLKITEGARVNDREIGWVAERSDNRNILLYRMRYCPDEAPSSDPCWQDLTCQNKYDCWDQARATIAITTTTYDPKSGQIFDADIEGNGRWFEFTTVDSPPCVQGVYNQSCVATDVQNTMTHELGHALGLDHTAYPNSTMNPSAPGGETTKRYIDTGTRSFMCETYPVGAPAQDCVIVRVDPTLGDSASGCTTALAATPLAGLALLAWQLLRRSRRRGGARVEGG